MKKLLLSLTIIIAAFSLKAQKADDVSFSKGASILHFGIGFGGGFYTGTITLPPVSVSYEKAITENISVGCIIGYSSSKFDYFTDEIKYTYILVGVRGNYHFATSGKFDPYIGATLGYNVVSVSEPSSGSNYTAKGSALLAGGQLGANYYISANTGIFGEVGYGIGVLTVGLTTKF